MNLFSSLFRKGYNLLILCILAVMPDKKEKMRLQNLLFLKPHLKSRFDDYSSDRL